MGSLVDELVSFASGKLARDQEPFGRAAIAATIERPEESLRYASRGDVKVIPNSKSEER